MLSKLGKKNPPNTVLDFRAHLRKNSSSSKDNIISGCCEELSNLTDVVNHIIAEGNLPIGKYGNYMNSDDLECLRYFARLASDTMCDIQGGIHKCRNHGDMTTVLSVAHGILADADNWPFGVLKTEAENVRNGMQSASRDMALKVWFPDSFKNLTDKLKNVLDNHVPIAKPLTHRDYAKLSKAVAALLTADLAIESPSQESSPGYSTASNEPGNSIAKLATSFADIADIAPDLPPDPVSEEHPSFEQMTENEKKLHKLAWQLFKSLKIAGPMSDLVSKCDQWDRPVLLHALQTDEGFLREELVPIRNQCQSLKSTQSP